MKNHCGGWMGLAVLLASCCLAACSGGIGDRSTVKPPQAVPAFTVGGTVSGLTGTGLVLQDAGADNLAIPANGSFTFATSVASGSPFNVSVLTQPTASDGSMETCAVSGGTGTIGSGPVTSVAVVCVAKTVTTDTIGGTVAGLAGTGLVLQNSDGMRLPVTANGPFTIATAVPPGTAYSVTVATPPVGPAQDCTVANGSGTTASADINSIAVTCVTNVSPTQTVGGTVTGLSGTGASIVLMDNGRDPVTITADGSFTFPMQIAGGSAYSVTAQTSGSSQSITCTLGNASGVVGSGAVTNVTVTCQINTAASFTVSGTVTGINGTGVTLLIQDGSGGTVTVSADGPFTLPSAVPSGTTYTVTAQSSSPNVACTVSNGSSVVTASVTNIAVSCHSIGNIIGGTVSGLTAAGGTLVLQDAAAGTVTVTKDGSFTLPTAIATGTAYSVTAQPSLSNVVCTLSNATGVAQANVTSIAVSCHATYQISGTVTGLSGTGGTLMLLDGQETLSLTQDGPFTFQTPFAAGSTFTVTQQPSAGITCTLGNASGTLNANVTNVTATCQLNHYPVNVTVTGLSGTGATLVLQDNGGDAQTLTANGSVTFATQIGYGASYAVTDSASGTITCTVSNPGGTVTAAVNVTVSCAPTQFYIPFQVTPTSTIAAATTSLFVVPSNNPAATPVYVTPAPVGISTANGAVQGIGVAFQTTIANGFFTGQVPYAALYLGQGSDQLFHFYALHLTPVSAAPTVTQLSSAALTSAASLCNFQQAQANLLDATTAFVLVQIAGSSGCGSADDVYEVIHYTDSASIAPTVAAVNNTIISTIYQPNGTLGGMVLLDNSGNLDFYPGASFSNPKVLATGVTSLFFGSQGASAFNGADVAPGPAPTAPLFAPVTTVSSSIVYRVDSSGNATQVYTTSGTFGVGGAGDGTNYYFTDQTTDPTTGLAVTNIVQVPLAGGAPMVIYSGTVSTGFVALLDSDGTSLLFTDGFNVYTIPVGVSSTTPTLLASGGNFTFEYAPDILPTRSASALLVSICGSIHALSGFTVCGPGTSAVYSFAGAVRQAPAAGTEFLCCTSIAGYALQVQGVTATDGSFSGGTLMSYNIAQNTFAAVPLATSAGTPFTFPSGQEIAYEGPGSFFFLTGTVGEGSYVDVASGNSTGVVFDVSRNLIVPIPVSGALVEPFLRYLP